MTSLAWSKFLSVAAVAVVTAFVSDVLQAAVVSAKADAGRTLPCLPSALRDKPVFRPVKAKQLGPGVSYMSAYFKNPFGDGPISTHWLFIEWTKAKDISLNIHRHAERRECPTTLAVETKALACVNGAYHTTVDPSTPVYQLKVKGELVPSQNKGGDGSFAFNRGEMPFIGQFTPNLLTDYENVISCDGVPGAPLSDYKDRSPEAIRRRNACRAPRTFAGNIVSNKVTVIGIADGRSKNSVGVNYEEIRYMLEQFGCDPKALISFDGGGSTMMGIRKGGSCEVVNVPSDGRERRVAESIQILDAKSRADVKTTANRK